MVITRDWGKGGVEKMLFKGTNLKVVVSPRDLMHSVTL